MTSWMLGSSKYIVYKNGKTPLIHTSMLSAVNSAIKSDTKRTLKEHPRTRGLMYDIYVRIKGKSAMVYEGWLGAKRLRSEYKLLRTVYPKLLKKKTSSRRKK